MKAWEDVLQANRFKPPWDRVYREVLGQMMAEARALPGAGTAHAILLERVAHAFVAQKIMDAMADPNKVRVEEYWAAHGATTRIVRDLFSEYRALAEEGRWKREFIEGVVGVIGQAVQGKEEREAIASRLMSLVDSPRANRKRITEGNGRR